MLPNQPNQPNQRRVICNSGNQSLDAAVKFWLKLDKNPVTRHEVRQDIRRRNWDKLIKTMLKRQLFGTAGLRGRMAAGFNCMNDVIILQTAQGLLSYMKQQSNSDKMKNGIVIGYDGRHNSKRFALLTAKVFMSSEIPVHWFSEVCPTPLVSFTTKQMGLAAGVMVTASHNPKEDNGYKVYWSNGSQIIDPHDDNVLHEILKCLDIPDDHWNVTDELPMDNELVVDGTSSMQAYIESIRSSLHDDVLADNKSHGIDVVYSAMHGTGYEFIKKAFEAANLKPVVSVQQQQEPDPEFPTVKFPNPEEVETLVLSKALALEKGIRLVLANDPDADRLAVAEYDESNNEWKTFTGNEMGTLLGWWLLEQHYKKYPETNPEDLYIIASLVSSTMLRSVAKGRAQFVQTLTGFKWMGNVALLLQEQGKTPLFAFEEAIGYMCNPVVPDKDGVSAAVYAASLATSLYSKGSSLKKQLLQLYMDHGCHLSHNSYYICNNFAITNKIFGGIRNFNGTNDYPTIVGSAKIVYIHDLMRKYKFPKDCDNDLNVEGTGVDCKFASGEMVTFRNSEGLSVTIRTSGTEPKIKYYTELVCKDPVHTEKDVEMMKFKLKLMAQEFVELMIQPNKFNLKGASQF